MKLLSSTALLLLFSLLGTSLAQAALDTSEQKRPRKGSVIFIHPDGAGEAHYTATRNVRVGPDGLLHWDRLDEMGVYRGHQKGNVSSSSHAGATAHAYGKKVPVDSYGMHGQEPLTALSGAKVSILMEAHETGIPVGIVNSGHIAEPGTGVFVAQSPSRRDTDRISAQIIESGIPLILSGGEVMLLPEGVEGRFGTGIRKDNRNLIDEAASAGYTVVYTAAELAALDPSQTEKVLGVFAAVNTYNDKTEELLKEAGLPLYNPGTPTLAEMTDFALQFLSAKGKQFFLVAEEEGSDNFPNNNNAPGSIEALGRADDAMGVVTAFIEKNPRTLLVTAADSNAGGPLILPAPSADEIIPATYKNGAPLDGREGTETLPFLSAPDQFGEQLPFAIAWSEYFDGMGGIIAKAHGLNAPMLPNNVQNTDIYRLMYATLFGRILE